MCCCVCPPFWNLLEEKGRMKNEKWKQMNVIFFAIVFLAKRKTYLWEKTKQNKTTTKKVDGFDQKNVADDSNKTNI